MALQHFFDDFTMRPTQLLDQQFGLGLHPEDIFSPLAIPHSRHHINHHLRPYFRPWRAPTNDTGSVVTCDKDKFQITLDVQHFTPEEIHVKVVDNHIIVEGKHEEKLDEHGYVSRQFTRRYTIPKNHNVELVDSKLSSDGVLSISVPKLESIENKEKRVPITHTGQPHKPIKPAEPKAVEQKK